MISQIGRRTAIVAGLVLFLAGFAAVAYASNSWEGYHWDISTADSTNDALDLGDNLTTTEWKNRLAETSIDWNQSVLKTEVVSGSSNTNCDPTAGRVEICNGNYGDSGWLGIASVWIAGGRSKHITQGTVKVNDFYFGAAPYNTSAWRKLVMCQEVGHTLGLSHQDTNFDNANLGSCMDYTSDPAGTAGSGPLSNLQPNVHDYEMMDAVYAHLNSTGDDTPPRGGGGRGGRGGGGRQSGVGPNIDLNNPSAWGQAIRVDAQGRSSLYERHLANGETVFTFVTWVN
jgi:hypothetical protein